MSLKVIRAMHGIGRLATAALLVLSACTGQTRRGSEYNANVLTGKQLADTHYQTLYDAIEALKPSWLRARGPDSIYNPSSVLVYIDNNELGEVATLKTIAPESVRSVQFLDGPAASARWGAGHGAGVILVLSQ